jgi:hydroxymethylglutaryl-CoA lyase
MAGAAELAALLRPWSPRLWFLVPNRRGAEEALAAGVANLVCVVSATETHSRENLGRPIDRVLDDLRDVARLAEESGARCRASISVAWADPVEGAVPPTRVRTIAAELLDMGFPELTLCDTWGRASPVEVVALIEHLAGVFAADRIGLHLHDTFGTAAAGLLAGVLAGVRRFDGSVGGLGGCPFVQGARGNIATEAVVRLLQGMGLETGVDEAALGAATRECLTMLREEGGAPCPRTD